MILTILIILFLVLWFVSLLPTPPLASYSGWFAWLWAGCMTLKVLGTHFLQ